MANNGSRVLSRVVDALKEAFNRTPMAFKVQALRFQQKEGRVNLYLTALPIHQLLKQCRVDYYREDNTRGYQRPLTKSRLKQVSAFIQHEEGVLPISILLCIRQPYRADFHPETLVDKVNDGVPQPGVLAIPQSVPLWVVDGQHRLYGLEHAFAKDSVDWAKDYLLPVTIVEGIDSYEEMRHFHIINTRHKGVPTDVVDRHLLTMWELEGSAILQKEGDRNYLRARGAKLCDFLRNTPDSPWYQKVRIAGHPPLPNQLIRHHTMVASLEPALKDAFVKRLTDEDAGKILLNYWYAIRERWPLAFVEPRAYRIQQTVGVYALHMTFPDVAQLCRETNNFSSDRIYEILGETGVNTDFWNASHGHPLVRETGAKYMRALGEYLRERLPRLALPRL
ncbi:MAG: DGQHR domain-containing protein [Chloroflexota bacterium]|nr:DGQHR domain-containing protein [Chloroflexota bacterium]